MKEEIFLLDPVQLPLDYLSIISASVSNSVLAVATRTKDGSSLHLIDMNKEVGITELPLPQKYKDTPDSIYLSTGAEYLIICMQSGQNYFTNISNRKICNIFHNTTNKRIVSVVWPENRSKTKAEELSFVLGLEDGEIVDVIVKNPNSLRKGFPSFRCMRIASLDLSKGEYLRRVVIESFIGLSDFEVMLCITNKSIRLFHVFEFRDGEDVFTRHSLVYLDTKGKFSLTLSKSVIYNESFCDFVTMPSSENPLAVWYTDTHLNVGRIKIDKSGKKSGIFSLKKLLDLEFSNEGNSKSSKKCIPKCSFTTDCHCILIYQDVIKSLNIFSKRIDWEIPFVGDKIHFLTDRVSESYWISTNQAIYELKTRNENINSRKILIEEKRFNEALQFSKTPEEIDETHIYNAEYMFSLGNYIESSQAYTLVSNIDLWEVVSKFSSKEKYEELILFLEKKVDTIPSNHETEIRIICELVVDVHLANISDLYVNRMISKNGIDEFSSEINNPNSLIMNNNVDTLKKKISNVHDFIKNHAKYLNLDDIHNNIMAYSLTDFFLDILRDIGNEDKLINYWMLRKDWESILNFLQEKNHPELYYKYSPVVLEHSPEKVILIWSSHLELDPRKLICSTLISFNNANASLEYIAKYAKSYLKSAGLYSPEIYVYLMTIVISISASCSEAEIIELLKLKGSFNSWDLDRILRICKYKTMPRAQAYIHFKLNMYESAVELALEAGDLEMAMNFADDLFISKEKRMKMFSRIIEHQIQHKNADCIVPYINKSDISLAAKIMRNIKDIKKIKDLDILCLEILKFQSIELNKMGSRVKRKQEFMKILGGSIIKAQKRPLNVVTTFCEECDLLITPPIVIFPCGHVFHGNCLMERVLRSKTTNIGKILANLKAQAEHLEHTRENKILSEANSKPELEKASPRKDKFSRRKNMDEGHGNMSLRTYMPSTSKSRYIHEEISSLLQRDCPTCGIMGILSILQPLPSPTKKYPI